ETPDLVDHTSAAEVTSSTPPTNTEDLPGKAGVYTAISVSARTSDILGPIRGPIAGYEAGEVVRHEIEQIVDAPTVSEGLYKIQASAERQAQPGMVSPGTGIAEGFNFNYNRVTKDSGTGTSVPPLDDHFKLQNGKMMSSLNLGDFTTAKVDGINTVVDSLDLNTPEG
ncbi:MAG: hypothetical protein M1812_008490, partial [Candelaria pacifica]